MRTAYAALALCLIQRGELDRAETALSILEHPGGHEPLHRPHLLDARARLRLAQIRPRDALDDALMAGRLAEEVSMTSPGALQWRTTAALAQIALGERHEAQRLADAELALAQDLSVTRVAIQRCVASGWPSEAVSASRRWPVPLSWAPTGRPGSSTSRRSWPTAERCAAPTAEPRHGSR